MSRSRSFQASPVTRFAAINAIRKNGLSASPEIFTIDQLEEKLSAIRRISDEDDLDYGYKKVRFLLTGHYELKFGKEGAPTRTNNIPAHSQLSSDNTCITAGNLSFDAEDKIARVTHKSGDFRPTFQSLQFALFIMIEDDRFKFADQVIIEGLNSAGGTENVYQYSKEELVREIMQLKANNVFTMESSSRVSQERSRKRQFDQLNPSSPVRVSGGSLFKTPNTTPKQPTFARSESPSPCAVQAANAGAGGALSYPLSPQHSSREASQASPTNFRRKGILFS